MHSLSFLVTRSAERVLQLSSLKKQTKYTLGLSDMQRSPGTSQSLRDAGDRQDRVTYGAFLKSKANASNMGHA